MSSAPYNGEVLESREEFQERIIRSVTLHAEGQLYRSPEEMPYHNSEHMHFVHDRVVEYCDYAEENGKQPDRFALRLAAVLHDAGYHDTQKTVNAKLMAIKLIDQPFENKEAYSAWIAGVQLDSYGVDDKTITKVQRLIKKTNVNAIPRTMEEKMLIRADLDNITGPSQSFLINTLKLVREAEILDGPKNPIERMTYSYTILTQYLSKDLCLGDFDKDIYERSFQNPAYANIARLAEHNVRRTVSSLGRIASSLLPSLGKSA